MFGIENIIRFALNGSHLHLELTGDAVDYLCLLGGYLKSFSLLNKVH
jgi:hypothetical protein